jgi:hypothetical protein
MACKPVICYFLEIPAFSEGFLAAMTWEWEKASLMSGSFSGSILQGGASPRCLSMITALVIAVLAGLVAQPGLAREAEIVVTSDQALRFGTLLVPAAGSRIVSARGTVADVGLYQIGNDPVGPAQFTVTYDRGNESKRSINVVVQVLLAGGQRVRVGSVEAQVSGLESDIAAISGLPSGAIATFTMVNCRERRCTQVFRVGAKLDLVRPAGGAEVVVPLTASATVMAVY